MRFLGTSSWWACYINSWGYKPSKPKPTFAITGRTALGMADADTDDGVFIKDQTVSLSKLIDHVLDNWSWFSQLSVKLCLLLLCRYWVIGFKTECVCNIICIYREKTCIHRCCEQLLKYKLKCARREAFVRDRQHFVPQSYFHCFLTWFIMYRIRMYVHIIFMYLYLYNTLLYRITAASAKSPQKQSTCLVI